MQNWLEKKWNPNDCPIVRVDRCEWFNPLQIPVTHSWNSHPVLRVGGDLPRIPTPQYMVNSGAGYKIPRVFSIHNYNRCPRFRTIYNYILAREGIILRVLPLPLMGCGLHTMTSLRHFLAGFCFGGCKRMIWISSPFPDRSLPGQQWL